MRRIAIIWTLAAALWLFVVVSAATGLEVGGSRVAGGVGDVFKGLFFIVFLAAMATMISGVIARGLERSRLLRTGRRVPARIVRVETGHGRSGSEDYVRFTLRVEPPGEASYEIDTVIPVHPMHAPRLQPGKTVVVAVDRNDPKRVTLDVDASVA